MQPQRAISRNPEFTYDQKALRFRNREGRFVARSAIRVELARVRDEAAARLVDLSKRLQAGAINLAEWQIQARDIIKANHAAHAATARGGWAQMSQSDWGRVGALTRRQYEYLNRFALQIEQGLPLDGRFLRRARMYADAAAATYSEMEKVVMSLAGVERARRVTTAAESCAGCEAEAARGFVAIDDLLPIGEAECLTNCKCFVEYEGRA